MEARHSEPGRITFDEIKISYVCKACNKIWFGDKKRIWEQHCETQVHKNMLNAVKLSGKTNKDINNTICYEEFDLGFENKCRIGNLIDDDNE